MTHCTQLPTMPWVLELAPCKQRMDTEASKLKQNDNLQDRVLQSKNVQLGRYEILRVWREFSINVT